VVGRAHDRREGLIKIPLEPGAKPEHGKVSEMILEFARPLMEFDPGGPPDIQAVRNTMRYRGPTAVRAIASKHRIETFHDLARTRTALL
jgi:hypothetical protein